MLGTLCELHSETGVTMGIQDRISRRTILRAFTALAGMAALPSAFAPRQAYASMPVLPPGIGRDRTVAIVGAGVAGLTAGYVLANAGFKVAILEADNRFGGRSLTPRPVRAEYRDWWFSKYNTHRLFPKMYVSEYHEDPARSPVPQTQVCEFDDPLWDPQGGGDPVELFFNAGPGRIPSNHVALIDLCQRIGVDFEPYIFLSNWNLLQSSDFNGGTPIAFHQVKYSLMGQIAELLATVINDSNALGQMSNSQRAQMLTMLQQFGDLDGSYRFTGSPRLGFSHQPGGWRDPGVQNPVVPLDQTLNSGFVGGGNPEVTPGSFLFNSDNVLWQTSLMQPVGGMDRIWQRLIVQEIPGPSVLMAENDPRDAALTARGGAARYVGDLVLLNHQVTSIIENPEAGGIDVTFVHNDPTGGNATEGGIRADFCISTMAPNLLAQVQTSLPDWFRRALAAVVQTPAIKVGWQGKDRFWESENNIYGGISWTDDIIGQIWYPSEDFTAQTGVLTGAYNRGPLAQMFGNFDQARRLNAGLAGGEKLHAGFSQKVYADKGMTIAWQYMPHQAGGWTNIANGQPEVYRAITTLPQGRLYCAGDHWSYLPGWQEGSVTSAYAAVEAIAYGMTAGQVPVAR